MPEDRELAQMVERAVAEIAISTDDTLRRIWWRVVAEAAALALTDDAQDNAQSQSGPGE